MDVPEKLRWREQKLQHHPRAAGPGPLAVVAAAVLETAQIGVAPAAGAQALAQRARVAQRLGALAAADVQPEAEARAGEGVDLAEDGPLAPPHRGRQCVSGRA